MASTTQNQFGFGGNIGLGRRNTPLLGAGVPAFSRLGQQYGQSDLDQAASRGDFSKYLGAFDANTSNSATANQSDQDALNDIYNGNLMGRLNAISAKRAAAVQENARQAMLGVHRNASLARLTGGNGSYADKLEMEGMGGIAADEARQQADIGRQNEQYVTGLQTQNAGLRGRLGDVQSARYLDPIEARTRLGMGELARLNNLAGLEGSAGGYSGGYTGAGPSSGGYGGLGYDEPRTGLLTSPSTGFYTVGATPGYGAGTSFRTVASPRLGSGGAFNFGAPRVGVASYG